MQMNRPVDKLKHESKTIAEKKNPIEEPHLQCHDSWLDKINPVEDAQVFVQFNVY